jgi:hypothetical protein
MAADDILCYGERKSYPAGDFVNFGRGLVHVDPDDPHFTPHYASNGKPVAGVHIPRVEAAVRQLRALHLDLETEARGRPDDA